MGKIFKTATAFRKSLESRLMNISQETSIQWTTPHAQKITVSCA